MTLLLQALPMPTAPSGTDPMRWVQAAAELAKNPAFWTFIVLIVIFILCKWPPWRRKE